MKSCGALVVIILVALPGCGLTEGGAGDAGAPDVGVDVRIDAEPILEAGKDVVEEPVVCDPDALKCPGGRCTGTDTCIYYATCAEMNTARPGLPSKMYQFQGSSGPPYFAYCDMEKEGGGWTLVGRSVALAPLTNFGWYSTAGDPIQNGAPYSFDMTHYPGTPTEALVGVYTANKDWGTPVYKISLPGNFPVGFGASSVAVTGSAIAQPSCGPALATGLKYMGYTSNPNAFYFDGAGTASVVGGLGYAGFDLGLPDCAANGEMSAKQGQIFVR